MEHLPLMLVTLLLSFVLLLCILAVRLILGLRKKRGTDEEKRRSEMGFVVETFHDLMTKLKEKEQELEGMRRRAEDRASSVESYNENILQSVPSGVMGFDRELAITKINAAAEQILEMTAAEAVGRPFHEVLGSPITEMIRDHKVVERGEVGYTTRSGKRMWLGLTMSPLRDAAGSEIGRILVFTDLTELKAFHAQMELRERLSTLGEMSAGIAHELRNPMGVISGYTKILMKKADQSLLPAVEAIGGEVAVMDRIITDFLSFARPSEPSMASVDLGVLVAGCVETHHAAFPLVSVEAATEHLPVIRADAVLLRQAVSNIVLNAFEAMPEGGVLRVEGRVTDAVILQIADSGHGIPDNILDKIFLPFYTTKERGTGLGLSIVHKIITSHGGTINITSGRQGSTFTIRLPIEALVS